MDNTNTKIHIGYYAIFFCFAITLHNLEEAIWLPNWSQMGHALQQPVTPNEFHFAIIVITALAYLISFLFFVFPKVKIFTWMFIGFLGAMIFNAFFPHLLLTITMNQYAPGLVTGFILNVPINAIILYTLYKKRLINGKEIFVSTVIVGVTLLLLIPLLFRLGDWFIHT